MDILCSTLISHVDFSSFIRIVGGRYGVSAAATIGVGAVGPVLGQSFISLGICCGSCVNYRVTECEFSRNWNGNLSVNYMIYL
jgi:hypothetical protein